MHSSTKNIINKTARLLGGIDEVVQAGRTGAIVRRHGHLYDSRPLCDQDGRTPRDADVVVRLLGYDHCAGFLYPYAVAVGGSGIVDGEAVAGAVADRVAETSRWVTYEAATVAAHL